MVSGAEFVEGVLEVFGVDGSRLVQRGGGQCVMDDAVDLARQSSGSLEECLDGGRFEQRQFASGQSQSVGEIGFEFVAVEAADVVPDDEALAQRFVDGHGESASEFGESDEDQAQALFGVHGEVGEQSEVLEDIVSQVLGLVDDEHGQLFGLFDESGDFVADGTIGGGA